MFDVNWAPPTQETVASHRQKKASRPQASPTPKRTQRSSLTSSGSSVTSPAPSSRGISALGLFRKDDKKKQSKGKQVDRGDAASVASSQPSTSTSESTEGSDAAEPDYVDEAQKGRIAPRSHPRDSTVTESCQSSIQSEDSVTSTFSPYSAASSTYSHPLDAMDITSKHEFQHINRHSFVMRSTEVTITSKDVSSLQRPLQEVHISSDVPNHYLDIDSSPDPSPVKPRSKYQSEAPSSSKSKRSKSDAKNKRPEALLTKGPATSDPWQPPSDWACAPLSPGSGSQTSYRRQAQKPTHLSHQITRMAAASAKIMLDRLTEEWDQVSDADFYKDIMFEKQLWLLTALALLERGGKPYVPRTIEEDDDEDGCRVLSLFESKASFTFNLTFSSPPALPLHHPIPASSTLPFPAELFDAITSLPLPTLVPAQNIPQLLRECNRILLPGGTMKLLLLDATPSLGTMGTLMKAWLTRHLLGNLEKKDRIREVRKQMPILLLDAGFMGCDGEIKLSFRAAEQEFVSRKPAEDKGKGPTSLKTKSLVQMAQGRAAEEETMHKLSVIVGRLLWKELWGPYVSGSKFRWWWDDASIVEECRAMGTKWEGVVVQAVKRSASRASGK